MKRIFALLLVVVMAVMALASCAPAEDGIASTKQYYENSAPKKIVVVSTEQFGSQLLDMTTTITNGYLGNLYAATKTVVGKRMRSITEGSGENVEAYIEDINTTDWYVEGYGISSDKGTTWDANGVSFVPLTGAIAINLDETLLENVKYENNVLSFKVSKANVAAVFADDIANMGADVECEIVNDGAVVTSVSLSWTVPATENATGEDIAVSIVVEYTYDLERLNITLK